jgi:uncharacterized protein with GYD domain
MLIRWTDQGIRNIKDTKEVQKQQEVRQKRLGAKLQHIGLLANMME